MKRILPPTHFLLALVSMTVLHFVWPLHRFWEFPLSLAGLIPLVCGVVLNLVADRQFKHHQTTVKPFEKSSALITAFPFSFSRHPMYLGMTLILLGIALLFGTVSPLLPAAAFAILVDLHFIRAEEKMLADDFSHEWDQYRARVRRWL